MSVTAHAQVPRFFRLPAEPVDTALVRFGVQGGVSVGGFPVAGCSGRSHDVLGLYRPAEALRRLLPAGCSFVRVDARAFRIGAAVTPVQTIAPIEPAPSPADISELIVTAERRSEPLRGSPFAVSALPGSDIERIGAHSLADLTSQISGVAETNLGPGRDKLFIRGLSDGAFTGRTQSTVGLYFGDTPIGYNAPDPALRLADVSRVEVLRGPQGTLYGSGSIGGIVRIVPAEPDPSGFAASAEAETSLNEHDDQSFGGEAMVNVPLLGGRAAVRAVAYVDDLAGYLDNPALGLNDVNHGRRRGGRLSALVKLSDAWDLRAGLVRQTIDTADGQYTQGDATFDRTTRIQEPHDNDFSQIGFGLTRRGETTEARLSAAYIDHDLSTRYDATGAFDLPPTGVAAFDETESAELYTAEAMVRSTAEGRLNWLVGAFGSLARERSKGLLDSSFSGGPVRSLYGRRDELTEAAAFGELSYDLDAHLTVTVGARVFATWVETTSGNFDLAVTPIPAMKSRDTDGGVAPKLRISYAFSPSAVIYAQTQDGYRAGGFNMPAAADGASGGPAAAAFHPDRLTNYEIGGEASALNGTLTLRAALFKAVWRNVQTDQFRPSGLPLTVNIGDGSNEGLELEVAWRPNSHWRLRVNGLINDPELTRLDQSFPAKVDVGLPGVAKKTGAVDLTYSFRLFGDLRGELTGQAAYIGKSFLTFDGETASTMGDYGQGRVGFTVFGPRWRAEAFVNNVTDARGDTFAYGNPFSRTRASQVTPLPPRTFGLNVRRQF